MLARVFINYDAKDIVSQLSHEDHEYLRENVWGLRLPEWAEGKDRPTYWGGYGENIILDVVTEGPILQRFKIKFEIKEFKNTYKAAGKTVSGDTYNLNLALPNIGLLSINEVTWLEDACTQDLQSKLDNGWRILAVCPPNGARRPDYILGRTKED